MKFFISSLILVTGTTLLAQMPEGEEHPLASKRNELINATTPGGGALTVPPAGQPAPAGSPDAAAATPAPEAAPAAPPATAAPAPAEQGDAIPQAYRPDRYEATWEKNPFLIKVATAVQQNASFAEDWELKYLSERNGTVKAGILNRKTQEYRNITTTPDSEGFQLVSAKISRNRKDSEAEIGKGAEKATFKYSDTAPPPSTMQQRPGAVPGQPGSPATMQQRPGVRVPGTAAAGAVGTPQRPGVMTQQQPGMQQPVGGVPAPNAPPSAINRRRVLIPAPAAPTTPVP